MCVFNYSNQLKYNSFYYNVNKKKSKLDLLAYDNFRVTTIFK